jgi:hypothetical protein
MSPESLLLEHSLFPRESSQQYNYERWDMASDLDGSNPTWIKEITSYEGQVDFLENFLKERLKYMNDLIIAD